MINLLPDEHKREIRAARTNVILVRYIMILLAGVVVLAGISGGAYVVLNNTRASAQDKVADNEQRVTGFTTIKAQADAFRADLATAKAVYDAKVSYANLIYKIAGTVPKNVILDNLSLDAKSFGSSATMNASAKSFDDASRLKEAFIARKDVFSNVQFQRLQYSDSSSGSAGYPVKVNLTVVIVKEALK